MRNKWVFIVLWLAFTSFIIENLHNNDVQREWQTTDKQRQKTATNNFIKAYVQPICYPNAPQL